MDLHEIALAAAMARNGGGTGGETYTAEEKAKLAGIEYEANKTVIATNSTAGAVKPDGTTITVDNDGTIHATQLDVSSWYGIRDIVEQGLARRFFRDGDQLVCMRGSDRLVWDIVNIAPDGTAITLLMHDIMPDLVFDAKEAIFAFENGLAAGTYHFTISQHSWVSTDVGKTLQFTLTQDIPAGGQLVLNGAYNVSLVGTTISSYSAATATTATETVTMTEGDSGTDLGSLTNAGTPASGINSIQRALLGSNNWKESAQRQMMNSDKPAGSVWTPQTVYDRPPSWVSNTAGFLYGLDEDFLSVVTPTTYTTVNNTVSDGGGEYTLTDKFFLPSRTEIFGDNELTNYPEGTQYAYYVGATNADRIKYKAGSARAWRLRTPSVVNANSVRTVSSSGAVYTTTANIALGWSPACRIAKS